ncbi:MAG: polysaccharide pyruvyl transferase family protein [Elainella sp. C42_A2020_010]|nr:polysaccharide pyruvyl transferase family protein [Elainella sp. C42_A2020_010]
MLKLREQKAKQLLDDRSTLKATEQGNKPKLTLLIEQDRRHWFSRPAPFVPLSWAATSNKHPYANLGDALSPILVSALSGLPVVHRDFESWQRRLACVGTIAHGFKHGAVHLWGTGIDPKKNPVDPNLPYYQRPDHTNFHVHAVRGLFTAKVLKQQGIEVPPVYGDPVWFLPSLIKPSSEKRYELGVVVHLTELAERTSQAGTTPNLLRYQIPPSLQGSIRIITTLTEPSFAALEERVQEITACKRIVSTSLHGLVISEAYGIPCVALRIVGQGASFTQLDDDRERVDWRIRDFYSGVGIKQLFVYGQRRLEPTHWENLIEVIDRYWTPLPWSPDRFLDAFPLPLAFNPLEGKPFENRRLLEKIRL